ncbi:chromate transporter [Romboutsia lituseburensis]|uniref:Chromate transporter n=1 Tax=Romboutsia lituseburensis DSM 797 TaxID=1121325 RepID=A0A1G9RLS0_9FIRM|nr:chromate transporter [Romboutsia lituseburensis]CEH32759.1 Chromate transport protein [Romboutsia lituseburensis]SDM24178.1 chromate transporter [Romboutsia lituseburensis DSM 797]
MYKIILLFLIFLKIGAFSFGGGYAMLPFIQQEFIHKYNFISSQEFLDLLALSQSTPGPIAINCATFIGYKVGNILGSISATLGVIIFSVVCLTIISKLFDKFKDNPKIENLLVVLRPITLGFILAAAFSSALDIPWDLYSIIAFVSSFYLLYTKKIGSISAIFIYGIIGMILFM